MGRFAKYIEGARLTRIEGSWDGDGDGDTVRISISGIKAETDAAVLLDCYGETFWVPKSLLLYVDTTDGEAEVAKVLTPDHGFNSERKSERG